MTDDLPKWQTTDSHYIVNDRWLKLRSDACVTPDGHSLDPYYVFEYNDWITCLVVDKHQQAILIKQYRHGAGEYVLEIVAGGIDSRDGSPKDAARRELAEELGYTGGELFQTGVSYANPANQTNKIYSFLAVGGSCTADQMLEPGENIRIETMPFAEAIQRMGDSDSGEVVQSFHIASILLAQNFIRKSPDHPALSPLATLLDSER